jgi:diphthamide biosynthesis methyltransferase
MYYHFGVPAIAIWLTHIVLGLYFCVVGYMMLNNYKLHQLVSLSFIVMGVLMLLYHAHLWYNSTKKTHANNHKH